MSAQQEIPDNQTAEPAPINRVLVFGIIGLALLMMAVDGTIVATALDALQKGLDTTVNWAGWTITAYAFGFMVMLPISGKLSHRYGNRRVFIVSIIVFTIVSLLCGLVNDIYSLIILRILQAAGGAGFTPAATGIIVQHFGDARDRAVGLIGSIFPVGAMIGPIFGGMLITYWSWRSIFLVNVPAGIIVTLLVLRYVPHDRPEAMSGSRAIDLLSMLMMGIGISTGMLAITYLGNEAADIQSPWFIVPLIVSVISLGLFIRRIHRVAAPFISPHLIHGRAFGIVNLVNIIFGGATTGLLVLVPLYASNRYDLSAFDAGTLLIAQGVASILFVSSAAFMLRRTGYRPPIYLGAVINMLALLMLASAPRLGISPYVWLTGATFLAGTGSGIINPATRNAGLQLEPDSAPAVAAIRSMCMQVGKILTISIATAFLATARDPGLTQSWLYMAMPAVLLVSLPLVIAIPEHRGAW